MTRKEKLQAIREKCIEANPEIAKRPSVLSFNGRNPIGVPDNNGPEVRLADVLYVMLPSSPIELWPTELRIGKKAFWNLRKDDLTEQLDETIDFIHSLLCV